MKKLGTPEGSEISLQVRILHNWIQILANPDESLKISWHLQKFDGIFDIKSLNL